jgi:hypothetical protein
MNLSIRLQIKPLFFLAAVWASLQFATPAKAQAIAWEGLTINAINSNGGLLIISGTPGDDRIALQRGGARLYYLVKYDQNWNVIAGRQINNVNFDINNLLVTLGDGNDRIFIGTDPSSWFIRNLYLYGGAGTDGFSISDHRIPYVALNGMELQY